MPAKTQKLIFELTAKEKEDRFKPVLADALKKSAALDQPLVYKNELCVTPAMFVHEYPNGKKILIEQQQESFDEITVQVLN